MSIMTRMQKQTCVYWIASSIADEYGRYTFAEPIQISCRWEDKLSEYVSSDGTRQTASASIYVSLSLPVHTMMYKGTIMDLQGLAEADGTIQLSNPKTISACVGVCGTETIPNLKNTESLHILYTNP